MTKLAFKSPRLALCAALLLSAATAAIGQTTATQPPPRADGLDDGLALRPMVPNTRPVIVHAVAPKTILKINSPMAAPDWALAEVAAGLDHGLLVEDAAVGALALQRDEPGHAVRPGRRRRQACAHQPQSAPHLAPPGSWHLSLSL